MRIRIATVIVLLINISVFYAQEKPNILFIFADDQTFESLGAINNPEIKTPNLDRLLEQGTLFTQTFNQGSWSPAVCLASRAMLNSGLSVWDSKNFDKLSNSEGKDKVTPWSLLMKNAGYDTYMTGKWHVRLDANKLFDEVRHVRPGMPNQTNKRYARKFLENEPDTWSPYDTSNKGYWKGGKHWSVVVADNTLDYLRKSKEGENPFFMYVAFNAPHDPRQSPKKYVDMYPIENIAVPESFLPEYPYAEEAASGKDLRDEQLAPFPRTEYSVKVNRQEYYAIITHMDAQIGRILDALEQTGQIDNTYIIFTADHGLAVGDHGFIGKQNMYDQSMRVPMIISGPRIPKSKQIHEMVYLQDAMATSLEIAEVKKPNYVAFNSLLPLTKNSNKKSKNQEVYGAYLDNQRMLRSKDFKLIVYPTIGKIRFYDIKNDPNEIRDLALNPSYSKEVKKHFKKLFSQQKKLRDQLDLSSVYEKYLNNF
ncbi:sulfatase-like hydrolase/transferase [Urechidicola vernalis]|uniref:Sulfatase-like hydrolase/transferase n=1 Tax=Urechidicola vernalis TaxID=3075600 RepID=A0ABU2Y3E6_9FLAO|nr:sulfatase-like hydrolase/transferase [Urechidicola sp. P050]MDT0552680.1 sulfatase-like hydrolase/transferase [Urechidicola sp. P050]